MSRVKLKDLKECVIYLEEEVDRLKKDVCEAKEDIDLCKKDTIYSREIEKAKLKVVDFEIFKTNLRKRDELIRTNFLGKLKNKKLIDDFKSIVVYKPFNEDEKSSVKFEEVKQMIIDYDFKWLYMFYDDLKIYESKQEVLDNYKTNKNK